MEFRLLGPVEVWASGRPLAPFARKPTALLTAGLLDAGRVVSVDRLIDAVWGEGPPDTAAKLVQSYVSRLRQVLHRPDRPEVIVTRPGGYLFLAGQDGLDVRRFQELLERGRTEAGKGEHTTAANTLKAALSLWRGPALGGPATSSLQLEAALLEEMRMTAVEEMLDARLAAGGGAELVGELTRLVAGQPLRERLRGLLMAALHRCGRRAEALRVYRDGHRVLRTELGIEPSHALRDLHARLLTGDARDTARPADGVPGIGNRTRTPATTPAEHQEEHQKETRRSTAPSAPVPTPTRAVPPVRRGRPGRRPGLPPPAQLPAPPRRLTGRDAEADHLVSALLDTDTDTGPRLCVVHGMAGVGKSALTLEVANRLAAAFPDGQLYAELCGADPAQAVPPDRILGGFLRALGVRPARLPASTAERAAAYRSLLAGRRVLVVLDDAAGEHQVRPLFPGAGASAVLVSSRRTLPGLEVTARVGLEVLDREQTLRLLGRLVGHDRLTAEATAAAEIARLSGGLPLAVQVVGSRLRTSDRWRLRTLADRLRDESHRLDELACGDLDVRASIEVGYRALPERERRAFHRLGMLDLPDFAAWVAGPLLAVDLPSAQHLVERLAEARLLEPLGVDEAGQTRYRFHDLVRLYARERAEREVTPEQRRAAVSRLLHSWLTLVCRAGAIEAGGTVHLKPRAAGDAADPTLAAMLLDRPRAWLASEHTSLVTAVDRAAGLGLDEQACGPGDGARSDVLPGRQSVRRIVVHPRHGPLRREAPHQQVQQRAHEQGDADEAVDLEERPVEAGQVVRLDDRVLVHERGRDDHQAQPEEGTRLRGQGVPDEEGRGECVAPPGSPDRGRDAEAGRDRHDADLAVRLDVLAGVDQVEAADPDSHREAEDHRVPGPLAGDRQPAADRAHGLGETEDGLWEVREPLAVGVDHHRDHGDGGQREAERVEQGRGAEEEDQGDQRARPRVPHRHRAGDQLPLRGTGVAGVDLAVDDPVRGHGERPQPDHRDGDEEQPAPVNVPV
ncbi:hypothetical protein GCM10023080_055640 [Streptomyces pseudoechinosporeus]